MVLRGDAAVWSEGVSCAGGRVTAAESLVGVIVGVCFASIRCFWQGQGRSCSA